MKTFNKVTITVQFYAANLFEVRVKTAGKNGFAVVNWVPWNEVPAVVKAYTEEALASQTDEGKFPA